MVLAHLRRNSTGGGPTRKLITVVGSRIALWAPLALPALWQRLLGRPASESGRLRQGTGGPARGHRRSKGLELTMLGAIVGEFVAASRGLGYLLSFAQSTFNSALMLAIVLLIMAVVLVIFALAGRLERYLLRWN